MLVGLVYPQLMALRSEDLMEVEAAMPLQRANQVMVAEAHLMCALEEPHLIIV